jgi:hypothetical protein
MLKQPQRNKDHSRKIHTDKTAIPISLSKKLKKDCQKRKDQQASKGDPKNERPSEQVFSAGFRVLAHSDPFCM